MTYASISPLVSTLALALGTVIAGGALCAAPAMAQGHSSSTTTTAQTPDQRFEALYTAEYAWRQTMIAPDEDNANARLQLPDVGPKAQAEKLARWTETMRALNAIDPKTLSRANQINYLVYKQQIGVLLEDQKYREYEKPLTSDTSFWSDLSYTVNGHFKTEQDYTDYLEMLREIPRYFDQNIVNMRAGMKRGFTMPQITLQGRDVGVAQVIAAKDPQKNMFFKPFEVMPATIPADKQATMRAEAEKLIADDVIPAHQHLLTFLRDEYIPGARKTLAAYDLPDGKAYYRSKIREFVTLDMSPEQIHQIGLDEVAKIHAQMLEVMKQVDFKGDLPAFLHYLRTDPRFYPKNPQDLLNRAAWIAKEFDGVASQWFGRLPRSRFAIKPVPADLAPFYTGGRGGPGIYLVNTYDLKSRPYYQMVALTLHESAPGHAFQMPLAAENKDLPQFRRDLYISAYGEGWALYCEKLGVEMGMYTDPYDKFGMLSYQMWRAARLVVDTGIHTQGWTRARAQQYLRDNTALSEHEIETEVDRYIAWPGQALSYYMGELAFLHERARAEKALGEKFNIRAWHDAMLQLGSVPLEVLTARNDQFIADGGKGPYPDEE